MAGVKTARARLSFHPRELAPPEATRRSDVVPSSGTYPRAQIAEVLRLPDPRLTARAEEVDPTHPEVVALARLLTLTMRASPACVGLAATQIGEPLHVFCMDVTGHKAARSCAGLVVLANARILARRGEVHLREGCMSVPHLTGNVTRAAEVDVQGVEPHTGRLVSLTADGIEARCLQHELDHLDGLVFVDRVKDRTADLFPRKHYV